MLLATQIFYSNKTHQSNTLCPSPRYCRKYFDAIDSINGKNQTIETGHSYSTKLIQSSTTAPSQQIPR